MTGFEFKIRLIYLAENEVKNKAKVVNGFVGYMKQFTTFDLNSIKPDMGTTATSTAFLMQESRLNQKKNSIFRNYISRDPWAGKMRGVFNVEELATIWHFPNEGTVKAPLIQKVSGKRAEPPMTLPEGEEYVGENLSSPIFIDDDTEDSKTTKDIPSTKPKELDSDDEKGINNLPIVEDKVEDEDLFIGEEDDDENDDAPPMNLPTV